MNPGALALADYMSELSEQAYYASWMSGLEFALWRAVTEGPFRYGRLDLTAVHIGRLQALSEACGGWIAYREHEELVSIPQWLDLYREYHAA